MTAEYCRKPLSVLANKPHVAAFYSRVISGECIALFLPTKSGLPFFNTTLLLVFLNHMFSMLLSFLCIFPQIWVSVFRSWWQKVLTGVTGSQTATVIAIAVCPPSLLSVLGSCQLPVNHEWSYWTTTCIRLILFEGVLCFNILGKILFDGSAVLACERTHAASPNFTMMRLTTCYVKQSLITLQVCVQIPQASDTKQYDKT